MAKIKGIELKNIVNFKGHEGEPLRQGSVYYNGKKVGFYSDGDFGREATIDVPTEIEVLFKDYRLKDADFITGLDALFYDLLELIEDEKIFKKLAKQGASLVAIFPLKNGFQMRITGFIESVSDPLPFLAAYLIKNNINDVAIEKTRVYTSLSNFVKN